MNEPKRWSSPGSEVDPVLRGVLRYARNMQPNSAELSAVVHGTVARHRPTPAPRSRRRVKAWGLVALAATFAAGAALASYANRLWFAPLAPASSPLVAPASALPAPRSQASSSMAPAPRPELAVASPVAANSSMKARATPGSVASAAPAPAPAPARGSSQDAALLQEARVIVASNPARALTLTRDHELHFPNSALTEERQALRIEALSRLGRQAEAARGLLTFEQRFPRSIYTRRLHALPVPDSK
jgi:hypothetical protein